MVANGSRQSSTGNPRRAMSESEAVNFERFSGQNAAMVLAALKCKCQPYSDVFTFKRWLAQGYAVQKGEKALRLPLVKDVEETGDDGETVKVRRLLGMSFVFCRCQVASVKGAKGEHAREATDKAEEAKAARTPHATGIVRPSVNAHTAAARRARFLSNTQLAALAEQEGANPFEADWYDGIDSVAVKDAMERWEAV